MYFVTICKFLSLPIKLKNGFHPILVVQIYGTKFTFPNIFYKFLIIYENFPKYRKL